MGNFPNLYIAVFSLSHHIPGPALQQYCYTYSMPSEGYYIYLLLQRSRPCSTILSKCSNITTFCSPNLVSTDCCLYPRSSAMQGHFPTRVSISGLFADVFDKGEPCLSITLLTQWVSQTPIFFITFILYNNFYKLSINILFF